MDVQERYTSAMVHSGVGDALGYKNGDWEFARSGETIHSDVEDLGGVEALKVNQCGMPIEGSRECPRTTTKTWSTAIDF